MCRMSSVPGWELYLLCPWRENVLQERLCSVSWLLQGDWLVSGIAYSYFLRLVFYFPNYRLFGTKCDKCGLQFSKSDFVMRARSKIYHMACFRCIACKKHLVPGDEFALREDGLFCRDDHEVLEKAVNGENNMTTPPAVTPIHHEASNSGQHSSLSSIFSRFFLFFVLFPQSVLHQSIITCSEVGAEYFEILFVPSIPTFTFLHSLMFGSSSERTLNVCSTVRCFIVFQITR